MDEVAEAVAVFGEGGGDFVDLATVEGLEAAAGGVGEHFLGETADEGILLRDNQLPELLSLIHI